MRRVRDEVGDLEPRRAFTWLARFSCLERHSLYDSRSCATKRLRLETLWYGASLLREFVSGGPRAYRATRRLGRSSRCRRTRSAFSKLRCPMYLCHVLVVRRRVSAFARISTAVSCKGCRRARCRPLAGRVRIPPTRIISAESASSPAAQHPS